jgi:hypothetical protein
MSVLGSVIVSSVVSESVPSLRMKGIFSCTSMCSDSSFICRLISTRYTAALTRPASSRVYGRS